MVQKPFMLPYLIKGATCITLRLHSPDPLPINPLLVDTRLPAEGPNLKAEAIRPQVAAIPVQVTDIVHQVVGTQVRIADTHFPPSTKPQQLFWLIINLHPLLEFHLQQQEVHGIKVLPQKIQLN